MNEKLGPNLHDEDPFKGWSFTGTMLNISDLKCTKCGGPVANVFDLEHDCVLYLTSELDRIKFERDEAATEAINMRSVLDFYGDGLTSIKYNFDKLNKIIESQKEQIKAQEIGAAESHKKFLGSEKEVKRVLGIADDLNKQLLEANEKINDYNWRLDNQKETIQIQRQQIENLEREVKVLRGHRPKTPEEVINNFNSEFEKILNKAKEIVKETLK